MLIFIFHAALNLRDPLSMAIHFPPANIVLGYWYSSLHMAAQYQPPFRFVNVETRLIYRYFIQMTISLYCSLFRRWFVLLRQFIGSPAKHKRQIIATESRNSSAACMWQSSEQNASFRTQRKVIVFLIFHASKENRAINYIKI